MAPPPTVYISGQCPKVNVVNVDQRRVNGLTAVPTVVEAGQSMVGTKAFEWLQAFEAQIPLDAYATVLGEGDGGLAYTDLDTDETMAATLFTPF